MPLMSIASNRVWQMRRVVITKDVISFAFVDEDAQIDYIPFAEILHVKEMADAGDDAEEDEGKYSHVMQIATRDDGYNSGRIYYLSTSSKEELDLLITELQSKAKKAHMAAWSLQRFGTVTTLVTKRSSFSALAVDDSTTGGID